ncbi:hypothetical protein M9H77_26151 [Catharanthus roseus]|uniref:Uncharacterized protein n=1 Tax=Catharanthus roseus TaxID=4058 RepID=A0ACC0A8W3_CATRO|nr:hypothetical protein M9H77_26151 [Catharanthus roseus]
MRCLRVHNRDVEIREEDVERILGLKRGNIDISNLVLHIKRTQSYARSNVSGCIVLLMFVYLERFLPVGEGVKPLEKRLLPRIRDLSEDKINTRNVEMVEILACPKETALVVIHKRLEIIDNGMMEIREDMKRLRIKIVEKLKNVEDNKKMMMKEIFKVFGNKVVGKSKASDDIVIEDAKVEVDLERHGDGVNEGGDVIGSVVGISSPVPPVQANKVEKNVEVYVDGCNEVGDTINVIPRTPPLGQFRLVRYPRAFRH